MLASGALARVLTHFAVHPDDARHVRALQRHTGFTPRSLQIELRRLQQLGVLTRRAEGRQVRYAVDWRHPGARSLRDLVRQFADPADLLRDALTGVPGNAVAFVFGSAARGDARPDSDIDLFVLGDDVDRLALARHTLDVAVLLDREVHPVIYSTARLDERLRGGSTFRRRVLAGPKRWIIGGGGALGQTPGTLDARRRSAAQTRSTSRGAA